ncbi:hypothetical protein XbrCFBP1976_07990 [Xanthomonas bromi]|uniref:Uncharacterized protein n=1 Tax=Xanthomonas bromi TaxID=56449 RepID=A0ABX5BRY4_9XANT|nr:hypothetical protein XbrCFBP1976_07990 [Xanthomonas bromi]
MNAVHTDQLGWSLPAHRRVTLGGMDAAKDLTGTYLQRVLRWWAAEGPAAELQIYRSAIDACKASAPMQRALTVRSGRQTIASSCHGV